MNIKLDPKLFNDIYRHHLFNYSHRYNVYYGGRSSGKSYFIVDKLVIKGLNRKCRMLFMMKQDNKVQETVWTMLMGTLHKLKMYDQSKVNKTEHTVEFVNGTYIKCVGLNDPERIKGYVDVDTVWMEEATNFTQEDFDLIDGTIRGKAKDKEIYLSFNPVSKQNWVYSYFDFSDLDSQKANDDLFILKSTYKDNKWCDAATIKRLENLKLKNQARYKIEAEGDFATLDKLVFPIYKVVDFNWKDKLYVKDNDTVLALGCDFGYNDPTAFIASVVDDTRKEIFIFDEHYERGMLNSDIAKMIVSKNFQKETIFFDCAEPKSILEVKKLGVQKAKPCRKGAGSINSGIKKILEYDIYVHPSCIHTKDELDNYSYKKNKSTGEYTNDPLDDGWCHLMDALRYSIQIVRKGKMKTYNKGKLGLGI